MRPRSWADMPADWREATWSFYRNAIAVETCPFCYSHLEIDQISPTGQVWAMCRACERTDLFDTIPLDTVRGAPKRT